MNEVIFLPIEKTEAEFRARVRQPAEFLWLKQLWPGKNGNPHWPYNKSGIRAIGGALRKDSDKVTEQSIRFSRKKKYKWTESKIKKWLKAHGYNLKTIVIEHLKWGNIYPLWEGRTQEEKVYARSTKTFKIIKPKDYEAGKDLVIEGVISSGAIDAYEEIVAPEAVMGSVPFYMKFPTIRIMHQPKSIGKALKIWRKGNKIWAKVLISKNAVSVIRDILEGILTAFSIGFMVRRMERICPDKDAKGNLVCYWKFISIRLVEISVVDAPANRDSAITSAKFKGLTRDKYVKDGDELFKTTYLDEIPEEPVEEERGDCPGNCPVGEPPREEGEAFLRECKLCEIQYYVGLGVDKACPICGNTPDQTGIPKLKLAGWDIGTGTGPEFMEMKIKVAPDVKALLPKAPIEMAWDGAGAKKRMAKLASSDGSGDKDKINWTKYARGFAYVDPEKKKEKGGYHLPFADVVNGTLKAVWRGVSAAGNATMGARGANLSAEVKAKARRRLKPYYKAFDKEPPWEKKSIFDGITIQQVERKLERIAKSGVTMEEPTGEPVEQDPDAEEELQEEEILEQDPDAEPAVEGDDTPPEDESIGQKILKAVTGIDERLKAVEKELERMKMTEEERAEDEKIAEKAAELTAAAEEQVKSLEEELQKTKLELVAKEAVVKERKRQASRSSMVGGEAPPEDTVVDDLDDEFFGMDVTDEQKATYTKMAATLERAHLKASQ